MIKALATSLGVMTENQGELKAMVTDFYTNLYTTEGVTGVEAVLASVPVKVTDHMNAHLLAPYTNEEVKTARFQMFPTKAPGPDGFHTDVIKHCWDIIAPDFYKLIQDFHSGNVNIQSIN